MQEWVDHPNKLKVKGEIKRIDNDIYYVTKIHNNYYSDKILSLVTYSKDYNQLSKVVGIPSEPRFYEISEQSAIKREVAINDYLLITTTATNILSFTPTNILSFTPTSYNYINDFTLIKNILFGTETANYPKYVITTFKGDKDIGSLYSTYGEASLYKDILSPINSYASGNTLIMSWEMVDNFSAGDKVNDIKYNETIENIDTAYRSLQAVQYTDKFGKATLFDFYILNGDIDLTAEQIRNLPESPYNTKLYSTLENINILATNVIEVETQNGNIIDGNERGLALIKDSREVIAFNYNLQAITDSDTFITSQFLFQPKTAKVTLIGLSAETNKLSSGYVNNSDIMFNTTVTIESDYTNGNTNRFGKEVATNIKIKIREALTQLSLSQEELYNYCCENGFLLYQAHPYRDGMVPQDPRFLHGVEVNCHPGHYSGKTEDIIDFAEKNGLRLICGSDFHGDHYKPKCGNYIPETVTNEKAAEILLKTRELMDQSGISFYSVHFVLRYPPYDAERSYQRPEGEINLRSLLYSDIYEEGMVDRVQRVAEETRQHYEEQSKAE
jgi:hypothetical protein